MNRTIALIAVLAAGAGFALPVGADEEHQHKEATTAAPAAATTATAEGEVREIDAAAGKVKIRHGWIRSLEMPPMTMFYRIKDKALLENLTVGDRIKFEVEHVGKTYTVLSLEKVK